MRLVLASTSPARLALLRAAGVEPVVVPSGVDEPAAVRAEEQRLGRPLGAAETVQLLADAKAEATAASLGAAHPDARLVLGGDSAFELDGVARGKPLTAEAALARWRRQRGRTGTLHSGHRLIDRETGRGVGATAAAAVRFADDLTDDELTAYVASGEPLQVAGAFTIDGRGGAFIDAISGDPSAVVGLSLPTLRRLVLGLGIAWTDLWTPRP